MRGRRALMVGDVVAVKPLRRDMHVIFIGSSASGRRIYELADNPGATFAEFSAWPSEVRLANGRAELEHRKAVAHVSAMVARKTAENAARLAAAEKRNRKRAPLVVAAVPTVPIPR